MSVKHVETSIKELNEKKRQEAEREALLSALPVLDNRITELENNPGGVDLRDIREQLNTLSSSLDEMAWAVGTFSQKLEVLESEVAEVKEEVTEIREEVREAVRDRDIELDPGEIIDPGGGKVIP